MISKIKVTEIITSREELEKVLKRTMDTFENNKLDGKTIEITMKMEIGESNEVGTNNLGSTI